ncbi:hypothetical protein [Novacetimonas pomaceti]|uniref:hypothetical protein n=1 Tax=Novacetimonas pomaceti TaxID=2021998 RepID=UPI001C2D19C1|nr:hypothetical protein [Novacetimonas pomaceti]MBV1834966.1 hypothetical protein [Novacetimonas pomaceti]
MKQSDFPARFSIPFADAAATGYIRAIPTASQIATTPGAASLTDGFPPVTFDPVSAGGTPPSGQDMNGLLNWITSVLRTFQSGYFGPWDATFAGDIGGYPMNAIVAGATAGTYYVSTVDDNVTTPGAPGAAWQSLFTGLQPSLGFTPVAQWVDSGTIGMVQLGWSTALSCVVGRDTGGNLRSLISSNPTVSTYETIIEMSRIVASGTMVATGIDGVLTYHPPQSYIDSAVAAEAAARANADAALQASKQDALGFTPVQQAAGPNQTAGTVSIGQAAAYGSFLNVSVNGTDVGPLLSGWVGGVAADGDSPVWGIHWTSAGRPLIGWGSATLTWTPMGTYADVQGVQANITAEATARANADAALQASKQDALGFTPVAQWVDSGTIGMAQLGWSTALSCVVGKDTGGALHSLISSNPTTGTYETLVEISRITDAGTLVATGVDGVLSYHPPQTYIDSAVAAEAATRANADAALNANFANFLPLAASGKNVTYGSAGGHDLAFQDDGTLAVYKGGTPLFSVGDAGVNIAVPVAGNVRSGTVTGGTYMVINDVMELTFSLSDVADQSTIDFPMAFSATPNVFFQPSLEANGDNLSCSLVSATATGCTVQIHNNANGSSTTAPTLVVMASGPVA